MRETICPKSMKLREAKRINSGLFDNWRAADFMAYYRGIDRFIYIPDKGIVGGSFDFLFFHLILLQIS